MSYPRGGGGGGHRGRGSRGRGGFGGMHIPPQGGRGRGRGGHGGSVFANAVVLRNDNGGPLPPITIPPRAPQGNSVGAMGTVSGSRGGGSTSPAPPLTIAATAGSPELPSPNTGGGFNHGGEVNSGGGSYMDAHHDGGGGGGGAVSTRHPTIIQCSRPYLREAQIQAMRPTEDQGWVARDISMRLNACAWILQVGGILQFPIRTMGTAMTLFNRFKLFYPKWEYSFADCAAAALFVASKIEDTLKKSREILAVGHSIKHGTGSVEVINPDSPILDEASRRCLSLERLILESLSFDFRIRHPQPFITKFSRYLSIPHPLARLAWDIQIDTYRTLSPLKATPQTQALAAIDLACRLEYHKVEVGISYSDWYAFKADVIDVMKDLLDLWTHYRAATLVGERYPAERYIAVRIEVNREGEELGRIGNGVRNGVRAEKMEGRPVGVDVLAPGITGLSEKDKLAIGESVRFMLDGERERREKRVGEVAV